MVPNIISVCTCNLSWSTEKWCQISFLYEKKYRRYVQGNFLAEPHRASEKCPKTPWEGVKKKAIPIGEQQT